jgi:hypothetical protein
MRPKLAEPQRPKRFIGRCYGLGQWVTQLMAEALEREPQHAEVVRG